MLHLKGFSFTRRVTLTLGFLVACLTSGHALANDARDIPAFIRMAGEWESVGVRAEPAEIFEAMPALKVRHAITGSPMEVGPGIMFHVVQPVGAALQKTQIAYVYDAASNKSFGVFISSDGTTSRGVIEHGADGDLLRLYDADGDVVWTERKVWISPDAFESEATFEFRGEEGRVWFSTNRKTPEKTD